MIRCLFFITCFVFSLWSNAQNKNLSNSFVFDGEPFLAINPSNSQHLVVAWMGWKLNNIIVIKTRVSFDAGQTWSTINSIPHTISTYQSADPSLAFDNYGNLFLCFIDYTPSPAAGAVYVVKSINGGLNWGTAVEVINANADGSKIPIDRPWMVIDRSGGTNDGNIYITSKPAPWIPAPNRSYFIRSIDGGNTFEPWKYIDTTNFLIGNSIAAPMATPTVSANGTFHALYPSYDTTQSIFPQYILASSTDGGSTITHQSAFIITSTTTDTLPKKGYLLLSNPADVNHLLFTYLGSDNGDLDIFSTESLNAGASWTTPIRVNDDPIANNKMQDLVWADFDNDGDLIVAWRDRRNAADSTYETSSEIMGSIRWKDSTNFSPNFVITDSSITYNNILAENGNDFMCVQLINDTVYAVWGDTRNGYLNIWLQQIDIATGGSSIIDLANDISLINIYPNPSKNTINIDLGSNDLQNSSIQLINVLGEVIINQPTIQQKNTIDLSNYPIGNYLIQFNNNKGSKTLKVIKEE